MTDDLVALMQKRLEETPPGWVIHLLRNDRGSFYVFSKSPYGNTLEAWNVSLEKAIEEAFTPKQADPIDELLG